MTSPILTSQSTIITSQLTQTTAIVIAGCTTDNLTETYLLSLSYVKSTTSAAVATHPEQVNTNVSVIFSNITNHSSLEVRAGYLGVCIRQNSDQWQCSGSASVLAIIAQLSSGSTSDPLDLIWIASNFRDQVVFVGLMYVFSPPSKLFLFNKGTES